MVGQNIGHYKILDKLGAGGMGEVRRGPNGIVQSDGNWRISSRQSI